MRKVSVGLEADVAGFIRPVETAKKSIDDLGDKVKKLDHELNKIPPDAAKAAAALKLLDGDVASVGKHVDDLGTKNNGLTVLDAKIRETQKEARKLADEFVKTGDVDVFKRLGEATGRLENLKNVRAKLKDALVDALVVTPEEAKGFFRGLISSAKDIGTEFGKTFSAAWQGVLSNPLIGPIIAIPLAAAIFAAMSFAGASIGGAVLAGIGGAAVGGGLAGAWMGDPAKYAAKWNAMFDGIQHRWLNSSRAFTNELDAGLKTVDAMLRNLPIEKILAVSQSFVGPLVGGASGALLEIVNGIADALTRAQPVVDKVGPELANLGHDIGDTFREISLGSEGGAAALGDLINVIGWTVKAVGLLIMGFEDAYVGIRRYAGAVWDTTKSIPVLGGFLEETAHRVLDVHNTSIRTGRTLADLGDKADGTGRSLGGMAHDAAAATIATLNLNDALTKTRNAMLGLADANIAVAQGWLDLKKGLNEGAKSLDLATQAGIDNQKNIVDQIQLLERRREQEIATGDQTAASIDTANAAYDAGIEQLRKAAYAAHLNKDQVDALIASVSAIPPTKTTEIKTPGLSTALDQGISLGNALNNIQGTYTAKVNVNYQGYNPGIALGNLLHHAGGGRVQAGVPSIVGEHRPEVFVPDSDGTIVPSISQYSSMLGTAGMRATGQMGAWSGGGGSGGGGISITLSGGDSATRALLKELRGVVGTDFGGRVDLALGQVSR